MLEDGKIALLDFPFADLQGSKKRPVLVIKALPGSHEDWLVAMLSTKTQHLIQGFDELVNQEDSDFEASGLKVESLIRVARLAVVSKSLFCGILGAISAERIKGIKNKISKWILE